MLSRTTVLRSSSSDLLYTLSVIAFSTAMVLIMIILPSEYLTLRKCVYAVLTGNQFLYLVPHKSLCFLCFFGPRGFNSGRLTPPFQKWISSNLSKKTNNPNSSPTWKICFGLFRLGASEWTQTFTRRLAPEIGRNPFRFPPPAGVGFWRTVFASCIPVFDSGIFLVHR